MNPKKPSDQTLKATYFSLVWDTTFVGVKSTYDYVAPTLLIEGVSDIQHTDACDYI